MDDKLSSVFQEILVAEIGGKAILTGTQAIEGVALIMARDCPTTVGSYFLKWNTGAKDLMFNREVTGLTEIKNQEVFRIPSDYGYGVIEGVSYLLLEDIIAGPISSKYWENFGEKLADLHCVSSDRFGFGEDNFIGKLQQVNDWNADWIEFFITNRLVKQLELAQSNNLISRELIHSFDQLFLSYLSCFPIIHLH